MLDGGINKRDKPVTLYSQHGNYSVYVQELQDCRFYSIVNVKDIRAILHHSITKGSFTYPEDNLDLVFPLTVRY